MSKMKLKKRYLAGFLAAAAVVTGAAAVPAYAARDVEVDRLCSLTVSIGEEGSYIEDLKDAQWEVRLYRIASVDEKGSYTSTDGFESLEESIDNVATAADWDTVAEGAREIIEGSADLGNTAESTDPAESTDTADLGNTAESSDTEEQVEPEAVITMADGTGTAQGLSTGLYLLLSDNAVTDLYEYTFQPAVALLPGPEYEGSETTPQGDWVYDQTTVLKYEQAPRYGSLRVVKSLDSYNASLGPATFVFQVEGVNENGETVYSNVLATTHSTAGTQSAVAERIPAGTYITVTEVYSGASYELVSDSSQTGVIAADEELSMEFVNTYDDELVPGYGAVNNFQYDEDSGWQWNRTDGNAAESE